MMSSGDQARTDDLLATLAPDEMTQVIARISDLALIVSNQGHVLQMLPHPDFNAGHNLTAWVGQRLADTLTIESMPKLARALANPAQAQSVELNHRVTQGQPEFPMRYSFHALADGDAVLMMGTDLRSTAEMQQQLVAAQIALEQDYEAQRDNNLKFRALMAMMDEPVVYVSARTGKIIDANAAAAGVLNATPTDLAGQDFDNLLGSNMTERMVTAASEGATPPITTTLPAGHVQLHYKLFRTSGEQIVLCKLLATETATLQPDHLRDHMAALFEGGVDAIVFTDADGTILSGNDAFLRLTDAAHAHAIKGRNIADFMHRGSVDLNVITENTTRNGAMRFYATKLRSELDADRPVEISTTRVNAGGAVVFAMIMRDASRIDTLRPKGQIADVDMQSVIEYIGNQSLRDIVAKTTDVVEKMCIETAVEMTSNNRVAAAEMLGLSRQSLYVKLRKYGLVKKD